MSTLYISNDKNKPTLHIDGKEVPPVIYALSDFPAARANTAYAQKNIASFGNAGVNLVAVDVSLYRGWKRITPFDPEPLMCEIDYALRSNPNSKILVRCHMNPPYWWLRDNPEECIIYRTPDGDIFGADNGEYERLISDDLSNHMRVSLASKKWLAEASEQLELFMRALKNSPSGKSVIAIQVACGVYGEWHQWGIDVSHPMRERFVDFLHEKYSSVQALRSAWNNPNITFETAEFRPEYFRKGDDGGYRDPRFSQDTIDAQDCVQTTTAEDIIFFSKKVKEIMPDILCGSFYGYYLATAWDAVSILGHLKPDMIYKSKGIIDFLCGPFPYSGNRAADGVPMQRALLESNRLNGMLWITEMDQSPIGTGKYIGGDKTQFKKTLALLQRETLSPLLKGMGFWYYDHRFIPNAADPTGSPASPYHKDGWWDSLELMSEISKIQEFAKKLTSMPYKSNADVLLVYDTESIYYTSTIVKPDEHDYELIETLGRLGVVSDAIYKNDLFRCDIDKYKCIIFVNCALITPAERERINSFTRGKALVFLNGHGFCDGQTLSEENISLSVGINLKKANESASMKFSNSNENLTIPQDMCPLFKVTDNGSVPMAFFEDGSVAAAEKDNRFFISYYTLPSEIARKIFLQAGVHCWCDSSEPVIAGFDIALINCQKSGTRTLYFPNGKTASVTTDDYATILYDINSGEQITL